jgi:hypothetical protein
MVEAASITGGTPGNLGVRSRRNRSGRQGSHATTAAAAQQNRTSHKAAVIIS